MSCICNNHLKKNINNNDHMLNKNISNNSYPGGIKVGDMWQDVSYSSSNQFIDGILWGAKWTNLPNDEITWTINYGNAGKNSVVIDGNNVNLIDPTSDVIDHVQTCMDDLEKIIGLSISKVDDINDAILSFNFVNNSFVSWLGIAIPPVPSNDPYYNSEKNFTSLTDSFYCSGNIYIAYDTSMNFQKGSYNYITIVHELGHALGLAHPHDTGGNSIIFDGVTSPFNDFGDYNANLQPLTIMTYNDTQSPYVPNTQSTSGFLGTFGPIDLVALQFMYGPNSTYNNLNTTYTFANNAQNKFWETIWDSGGINTIDASNSIVDVIIDLNDATINDNTNLAGVSLSYNLYGGFTIAKGVNIQNIITGQGNDSIKGNELDNQFTYTQGNDSIDADSGYDTVIINNNRNIFNLSYDQSSNIVTLNDGTNTVILKNCEKISFNDQDVIISELNDTSININSFLTYGVVNINHKWKKVNLSKSFTNAIVIPSDPTFKGRQSVAIRLKNITSKSFLIKLQEPNYLDGSHANETVCYVVGEKGTWDINGTLFEFNTFNTNKLSSKGFKRINFNNSYSSKPSVFSQIQTFNGPDWVISRTKNINSSYFLYSMQEEEKINKGGHVNEKIGWFSISNSQFTNNGLKVISKTINNVNHNNKKINYSSSFSSTPFLITKLSSFNGADTANLRIIKNNKTRFVVKLQEEQSKDKELNHVRENISYFAIK